MAISTRALLRARLLSTLSDPIGRARILGACLLAVGLLALAARSGLFASVVHERATIAEVIERATAYGPRVFYAVAFADGHRLIASSAEHVAQEAPGDRVCVTVTQRLLTARASAALAPAGDCARTP